MLAGKLDKTITMARGGSTVDEYGTETEGFTPFATVRAQVIQASTEEFLKAYGTTDQTAIIFRIRHRTGIKLSDQIQFSGQTYDLKEIKELGRREGLDLRCTSTG